YNDGGNYSLNNLVALNVAQLTTDTIGSPFNIEPGSTGQKIRNAGFQTYTGDPSFVVTSDPLFVNPASGTRNFHIQAGSPLRGAGTNLVWITSAAGSGTTFAVNDSQRLCDGFGTAEGDVVVIGSTTTRIVANNWSANTITVATSITWT